MIKRFWNQLPDISILSFCHCLYLFQTAKAYGFETVGPSSSCLQGPLKKGNIWKVILRLGCLIIIMFVVTKWISTGNIPKNVNFRNICSGYKWYLRPTCSWQQNKYKVGRLKKFLSNIQMDQSTSFKKSEIQKSVRIVQSIW